MAGSSGSNDDDDPNAADSPGTATPEGTASEEEKPPASGDTQEPPETGLVEADSPMTSIIGPPVIPEFVPEVLVLPIKRVPVFPRFLRLLEVRRTVIASGFVNVFFSNLTVFISNFKSNFLADLRPRSYSKNPGTFEIEAAFLWSLLAER